mmetsp:Transcript_24451/g.68802  ORF Transcript_24451/g.68802 Transcript_24451/m.68802 type:complete len:210 (+) Transcript_24451:790-1419(+)
MVRPRPRVLLADQLAHERFRVLDVVGRRHAADARHVDRSPTEYGFAAVPARDDFLRRDGRPRVLARVLVPAAVPPCLKRTADGPGLQFVLFLQAARGLAVQNCILAERAFVVVLEAARLRAERRAPGRELDLDVPGREGLEVEVGQRVLVRRDVALLEQGLRERLVVADVLVDVVDERRRAGVAVAPQLHDLFPRRFRQIPDRMDAERM